MHSHTAPDRAGHVCKGSSVGCCSCAGSVTGAAGLHQWRSPGPPSPTCQYWSLSCTPGSVTTSGQRDTRGSDLLTAEEALTPTYSSVLDGQPEPPACVCGGGGERGSRAQGQCPLTGAVQLQHMPCIVLATCGAMLLQGTGFPCRCSHITDCYFMPVCNNGPPPKT
jgi:hypothetical protein